MKAYSGWRVVRWMCAALGVVAVVGGGCRPSGKSSPPAVAVPVVAAEVTVRDQPVYVEYVGQTRGSREVEIRARVEGFLDRIHFGEGRPVSSNALLYTLDPRPFRAALSQAEGVLAQARALADKARRDTNRLGPLWLKNAISRQQYDDALSAELNAAASVQSAEAVVESARIQLGYTEIRSPIEGLAGKSEVGVGNLVGRGATTLLTTVSGVDPISVRFAVSEQQYLEWKRRHGGEERGRAASKGVFELYLSDGTLHPHRGDPTFADREVDPRTGTLLLQVSFPNPDGLVRPGQFARVRFPMERLTNAVLVPQRALLEMQATYAVYVVGEGDRAEYRRVTPGPRVGSWQVVRDGLRGGDRVVVEGIQKLQNNVPMAVTLTNLVPDVVSDPADASAGRAR